LLLWMASTLARASAERSRPSDLRKLTAG
jgi:hypothetical protein